MGPLTAAFAAALGLALGQAPAPAQARDGAPAPRAEAAGFTVPAEPIPLHLAALSGDLEAVRRHVAAGADLNAKDAYGSTPLTLAATFGRTEVARALLAAGADLEATDGQGSTPLHVAAFFCREAIVEALLAKGADRWARNAGGRTPSDLVAAPFEDDAAAYARIEKALRPLGLRLDEERIRRTRPRIEAMLRPPPDELDAVEYAPLPGRGFEISTPAAEGLGPRRVAELMLDAARLPTLYGVLVVKRDRLVAERYFNAGSVDQLSARQSATKSVTSALVGLAIARGCLSGVDRRMVEFFPELAGKIDDPRKGRITVRELLQMRGGYPWEGRTPPYFERLFMRGDWNWLPHVVDFSLQSDPGTRFAYSNLTSHLLAVIVARACKADLRTFAEEHLFRPIGAEVPAWTRDPDGYRWGWGEIQLTARDMARFGLLYLRGGAHGGKQVLPAAWVRDSLGRYSEAIRFTGEEGSHVGRYLRDVGYGYQWWSARAGPHRVDFAWGHGGQLVALVRDLDMVVVTTADPLYELPEEKGWRHEGPIVDLVGKFVRSLPAREEGGSG
jgi:CubicO group peptidase (beta-lactamase class C family)